MEASPVGLRAAWGRLTSRRYARGVLMVVGGTAAGQVLALAALPLITRLYTTSDFGVLAVYTSMLLVLMSVASLRYELTLSIAPDGQTAANLLALCLLLVVAVAAISGTVALVFADQIAAATNTPALADYMVLLPLGVLGARPRRSRTGRSAPARSGCSRGRN